mgnify:CR=1 FL=1
MIATCFACELEGGFHVGDFHAVHTRERRMVFLSLARARPIAFSSPLTALKASRQNSSFTQRRELD